MNRHFPIVIEQDQDGIYIVECPMFKGCRSYGSSIDEAVANIKEAIASCVPEYIEDGHSTFIGVRDIEMAIA
jgi:predicted RNase H-like HicB family nuclease